MPAYIRQMEHDLANGEMVPSHWAEALERARVDVEAGRTVTADIVMARLREVIAAWPAAKATREDEPAPL